jgi:hypothetical protein
MPNRLISSIDANEFLFARHRASLYIHFNIS